VSPLSLLTFFAAAKKVSAAPHRGEPNKPLTKQGKANTTMKTTKHRRTTIRKTKTQPDKTQINQTNKKSRKLGFPPTTPQTRRSR
jgi:hypothetical protein